MSVCDSKSGHNRDDHVVLLHGLGRGPGVMNKLKNYLAMQGFRSHNIAYPSTSASIIDLAQVVLDEIKPFIDDGERKVHFVGHSLGGIIVRYILQQNTVANMGRMVMLAPPNKGSEVADFFSRFSFYRKLFGPAGEELGVKHQGVLKTLVDPDYEVGIIAGNRSIDWLFSLFLLPNPNDGKVSVESTRLNGMKDHIIINATHPFMPGNLKVMYQTACFIKQGVFEHP